MKSKVEKELMSFADELIIDLIKTLLTPRVRKIRTWWGGERIQKIGVLEFIPVNEYAKSTKTEKGEIGMIFGKKIILK